jgi:Lipase (class 3)
VIVDHGFLAETARDVYTRSTVRRGDLAALKTIVPIEGRKKIAVWSIRGTELADPRNVIRDLCAFPVWDQRLRAYVAAGFGDGARLLELDIAFETEPKLPIVLTGHSLGGALALNLGASFAVCGRPPVEIVTWNAPRCGGKRFCKAVAGIPITMYRWTGDEVSIVPGWLGFARNPVPWTMRGARKPPLEAHAISNFIPFNQTCVRGT